jgi:hypothetical protein
MATVADLYTQILGRAPDAEGLAYWQSQFGTTVDPAETTLFTNTAQQILSTLPPAEQAQLAPNLVAQAASTPTAAAAPATITYHTGKVYDLATVRNLASQLAGIADPSIMNGGAFSTSKGSIGFNYDEATRALGAEPTAYDQVLLDAAAGLINQGITDISQIRPPEGAGANYTGDGVHAGSTATGPGRTTYGVDFYNGVPTFHTAGESSNFFSSGLGQASLLAGAYFGAPALSSAIGGATGLTGAALSGATGAALGGTAAGLTGGNVLTGALTGGALGYGSATIADALSTPTAGAASSSLTPEQLAIANATSDPIAAANALKGWTIADIPYLQSIGASADLISLAQTNNANLLSSSGGGAAGGAVTPSTSTNPLSNLTPAQTAALVRAGVNVAGLLTGGAAISGLANAAGGSGGTGMLTSQNRSGVSSGTAQYSPEYYQAIQAKYNQMMPQQPRDVTTDLKSWYETKYAPTVVTTPTTTVPPAQQVI